MVWDSGKPEAGIAAKLVDNRIRTNNEALEAGADAWNYFATGGTQSFKPRQGSARIYFQDDVPTTRLDGEFFDSTDLGTLWIDSNNDNCLMFLTSADGAGNDTWGMVYDNVIAVLLAAARVFASTLGVTGDFAINTDKFTVEASSGNVVVAGTLGTTGVATLGDGSLLAAATESGDGARTIADKAYVDDGDDFGVWNDRDDDGSPDTVAVNTQYTAATDGIVTAYSAADGTELRIETPVGTIRNRTGPNAAASMQKGICCPVKNGDTWKVFGHVTVTVHWMPIGH